MGTEVMMKDVRIAFIDALSTAQPFEEGGKKRYSATFLVAPESENDKKIREAIHAEVASGWPKNHAAMLASFKDNSNKMCYMPGDTKSYDGFAGNMALSAHRRENDGPPLLLDSVLDDRTGKLRVLTGDEGRIYAGCYVNAKVEIWPQSKTYPGIRCQLLAVQFCREGSNRPNEDGFEPLGSGASLV